MAVLIDALKAAIRRDKLTWADNTLCYRSKAGIVCIIGVLMGNRFITLGTAIQLNDPDSIGKITKIITTMSDKVEKLCPRCQQNEARPGYTCPYSEEFSEPGPEHPPCHCCENCARECADDI